MGMLVDGVWREDDVSATRGNGRFVRAPSKFHGWVTRDGTAGSTGEAGFRAEPGRYHLYVAFNCPWAHRAVLMRLLKGLESAVSMSVAAPRRDERGWIFQPQAGHGDDLFASAALYEIYLRSDPRFTGRVTVPVLWDRKTGQIVSNESADVMRMLDQAFQALVPDAPDYYPADLRLEIDRWNATIHPDLNNGVYRAGFAATQEAYDEAVIAVFETLDAIEEQLGRTRYLTGDRLTEADWRLFPTLVRFDVAYHSAFRCSRNRIVDFPNLWGYARELYQLPGIAATVHFDVYRSGYHSASPKRNPLGIVPMAPAIDWTEPHGR